MGRLDKLGKLFKTVPSKKRSKRWYVYAYIQPRQNPRKRTLEQFIKKDVFYVGKGTKNRSRDHLLKAMRVHKLKGKAKAKAKARISNQKKNDVISKLLDVGKQPAIIKLYDNITTEEAATRESCILRCIGLACLTNKNLGSLYRPAKGWDEKALKKEGAKMLKKFYIEYQKL